MKARIKEIIRLKRRSIRVKWSVVSMLFCFLVFTLFVFVSYESSILFFLREEKADMAMAIDTVADRLVESDENLTTDNIHKFLNYKSPDILENYYTSKGHQIKSAQGVGIPSVAWRDFQIYDVTGRLIFMTDEATWPLYSKKSMNPTIVKSKGKDSGYIVTRVIKSKKNGKIIGYVQSFNDLSFYYNIRTKLLYILITLEVFSLLAAYFAGYLVSTHFLHPLSVLHAAMKKFTKSPNNAVEKIEINSGDEIEDLADVFNDVMSRTYNYIEEQERFVSDVSHELRTPLAVLDGHINLLRRWGKDDPVQLDESLEAAHQEIQKMSSMIQDMLELSRLKQSGKFDSEETVVFDSVEGLVKNFKMLHQSSDILFETHISETAQARIYKNHYVQAVTILVDNAIKYSKDDKVYVKVTLSEDKENIITSVTDHGMGITKENQAHIFERFFRADRARNREIGGTGLGLSIIADIVEIYHGSISVTSEIGKGSTFTMKIPKSKTK